MNKSVIHKTFNPKAEYSGTFHVGPKGEQALLSHMRMIVPKEFRHLVVRETYGKVSGLPNGAIAWRYPGEPT